MFSALFLDHYKNWCANKTPCPHNVDFYIDCHDERYGIQKVKGLYNRVITIRIMKANGPCYEPFQQFSACQFHGAFFANIRVGDCYHNGASDIIADVYDADSFPVGTIILINNCCMPACPPDSCSDNLRHSDSHCHQEISYTLLENCIQLHI
jgi:hypothetical protein